MPDHLTEAKGRTPLQALLNRAEHTPEATVFIAGGERWSHARVAAESAVLAEAFAGRGIRAGDRIALHMYNLPELVIAYLACWRIGAIAVPLNTHYTTSELMTTLGLIHPALYIGQAGLYESVRTVDASVLPPDARFLVDTPASREGARPWADLLNPARAGGRPPHQASEAVELASPALLLSRSGTTGRSKLVVWTHANIASLIAVAQSRGAGPDDVFEIGVPMMHASGLWSMSACLLTGALMILIPRFDADEMLDAIAEYGCTTTGGMPFMCAGLASSQRKKARDASSLRVCLVSGDVCPAETEEAFASAFARPLLSFWGATEDVVCAMPGLEPGPLVRLLPDTDVCLVDENGSPVADGEAGEMVVRSPGTTPGYWLEPGRIEPFPDGWFHSGDLMRRAPDGQLRFLDRTKDLIVRGGGNVSPFEVETVLRQQPGVVDAAAAGIPDPDLGHRVGAVLVLADGTTADMKPEILAGVRLRLADYKVPELVAIVDAIPRNTLMKVDRHAVAAAVADSARVR